MDHRVEQNNGQVTRYLWDGESQYGDVIVETDAFGAPLARYVLGNGRLIAQTRGTDTGYYLADVQGSTRLLLDDSASSPAVTDTYHYDAFGELRVSESTLSSTNRYTGQQFDDATGLYSLRARYYNPATGRFLSRDPWPINFQNPMELNRYVYTAGNPVNDVVGELISSRE